MTFTNAGMFLNTEVSFTEGNRVQSVIFKIRGTTTVGA